MTTGGMWFQSGTGLSPLQQHRRRSQAPHFSSCHGWAMASMPCPLIRIQHLRSGPFPRRRLFWPLGIGMDAMIKSWHDGGDGGLYRVLLCAVSPLERFGRPRWSSPPCAGIQRLARGHLGDPGRRNRCMGPRTGAGTTTEGGGRGHVDRRRRPDIGLWSSAVWAWLFGLCPEPFPLSRRSSPPRARIKLLAQGHLGIPS